MKARAVVAVLLLAVAAQVVLSMMQESATSDEVPHLAAGYTYLKTGDYRLNYEHPPLVKMIAALPLLALDLDLNLEHPSWENRHEWSFGEGFINRNKVPAKTIIFWGRVPMVLLALMLGLLVYKWASEIYGVKAGLIALFLYAFCPNILGNAPLVTLDVGNTLFMVLSLYTFYHFLRRPRALSAVLAGCALGLALSSKMTSLNLLPIYFILTVIFLLKREVPGTSPRRLILGGGLVIGLAAVVILLAYRVTSVHYYLDSVRYFVKDVGSGGRPAFLFGHYSTNGWYYYFLAAMLVKTPIPSLILIGVAVVLLARRRRVSFSEYCLLVPVVFFLSVASLSRLQLGLRYILQIYPFLFIFTGGMIAGLVFEKTSRRRFAPIVVGVLLVWYCAGTLRTFPHYLAYFNELVGGPKNGYKCLLDSNLDWGQDLPSLAKFLQEEGSPEVILSFFGTAWPKTYGITYQDFYSYNLSSRREDHINSPMPSRELFVISANSLQCLYYPDKTLYDWLKQRKPLAVVGYTLFVYDITNDADAQTRLGAMYLNNTLFKRAERQFRRVLAIDPGSAVAQQYLDYIAQLPTGQSPPAK